jgi:3-oxoadipate enol-lactonase
VVVTTRDAVVPPDGQRDLARRLPDAATYELDGTHGVFVEQPDDFAGVVTRACADVVARASGRR